MKDSEEKYSKTNPKIYAALIAVGIISILNIIFIVFSSNRILHSVRVSEIQPLTWFILLLSVIALPVIPYGFMKRKGWSWSYAVFLSIVYALVSLFLITTTGNLFIWHPIFVLSIITLIILSLSSTRIYFKPIEEKTMPRKTMEEKIEEEVYHHGEFTLYRKLVPTKSGSARVFYFFSKEPTDKGTPCPLPEGYEVHINKRSGVPYLKKKKTKK